MRLKDLKSYIFILIILLLCFFGCTVMYEIGVSTISSDNAHSQAISNLNSTNAWMSTQIEYYRSDFISGKENNDIIAVSEFSSDVVIDNTSSILEVKSAEGTGEGYALYFRSGAKVCKVGLNTLLEDVKEFDDKNTINPILLVLNDGTIIGQSINYNSKSLSAIIKNNNDASVSDKLIAALNAEEAYAINATVLVDSNKTMDSVVVTTKVIDGISLVKFVDMSLVNTSSSALAKLRIGYLVGIAAILVLATVVLGILIRKIIKTSTIDAGVNTKTANIVLIVKSNGKILKYNKSFKVSFPDHLVPITSLAELDLVDGDDLKQLIRGQKAFILRYNSPLDEDNNPLFDEVYYKFLSVKRGSDYSIVGRVITEEYRNEQILIKTSTKSSVTDDDNAIMLDRYYKEKKAKYKAVGDPYLLLMTNLRGFRNVNSLLGFKAGNDVLCYFSNKLHELYEGYMVFHIAADEFVLLSPDGNEGTALAITEKLLDQLKAPILINNNEIMLRPAVGLLASDMDGDVETTHDILIEKLRIACDRAKNSAGRPLAKYDTNLENSAAKAREMEEDLKQAIAKNEFVMFYQPQYEINQERVCGFEALLRWNNPKYAGVSPQVYIEMAEKNGFIIDVGNFITKDVLKTAKEMEQYDVHISVNVSPAQIVQAGFVADLLDEFEKNNLQPGSIAVEVTETFLMENFQTVIEKLKILKNRGVSIHLDDFGTGYSSMLYLKELPIDTIKIDKEFIKHIETDRFSKVLTSKIISLAKELGDKVICEGVETRIQKDIVAKFGADIIQGYYIGKALSKEDAFALLKTGKVSSENKTSGNAGGN